MKSRASANRLWGLLQTEHEDLFADLQPQIIMFENAKKRVFRLRTGSFADYEQAAEFCERLLKHPSQAGCIPISN